MRLRLFASLLAGLVSCSFVSAQSGEDNVYTQIPALNPVTIEDPVSQFPNQDPRYNGPRFNFKGDYLLMWYKTTDLPALLNTGNINDPDPAFPGQPGTRTLLGGDRQFDFENVNGYRFSLGVVLGDDMPLGVELNWLMMGRNKAQFDTASDGTVILSRPIINPNGTPSVFDVAFPGDFAGSFRVTNTGELWTIDGNATTILSCNNGKTLEGLAGVRFMQYKENLEILDTHTPGIGVGGGVIPGSTGILFDQFSVRNQFWGAQLGIRLTKEWERFDASGILKVALGVNEQRFAINGATTIIDAAGGVTQVPGGLLASRSNIGTYRQTEFSVLPEIGLNVGFKITETLRLKAGYVAMLLTNTARSTEQIDPVVNRALVPTSALFGQGGPARPSAQLNTSDFWIHGVNFGIEYRY